MKNIPQPGNLYRFSTDPGWGNCFQNAIYWWNNFNVTFVSGMVVPHETKIVTLNMKPVLIAAAVVIISAFEVDAQIRRPAPTGQIAPAGQVPSASTGQAARPYSQYQPKPTGQIAPATGAQPAAGTAVTGTTSPVTVTQSATANQAGQIPKVNTNQDPATFPERYVPNQTTQTERVITIEDLQQSVPVQQTQPVTTYPATQQDANGNVTTQPATTTGQTQVITNQPQPATSTQTRIGGQPRTATQPRTTTAPQSSPAAASSPRAQP